MPRNPDRETHQRPLHRIRQERLSAGISLRAMARRTNLTIAELKAQEDEHADIRLSEMYLWQKELNVPLAELFVEPDASLSEPIRQRAALLRIAKTARSLMNIRMSTDIRRLLKSLLKDLSELMPELKHVGPWHEVGQRRGADELGRAADRWAGPEREISENGPESF